MIDPPRRFVAVAAQILVASIAVVIVPLGRTPASAAPTLPPGFQEERMFGTYDGFDHPTAIEFSPDGRVFVAEQSGIIKVFDSLTDTSPDTFADLRTNVHNYWDRGLLGLELDPQFPTDPYVYVLYAYDWDPNHTPPPPQPPRWGTAGSTGDGCPDPLTNGCIITGRVSRLQASGNTTVGGEQVLVHDWCQQYPSHTVGTVAFGPDGGLYVSAGDGASFQGVDSGGFAGSPPDVCDDPADEGGALRSQDLRTTTDPTGLDGTIIRLAPDASGNPNPSARQIVSTGLRNPFRFTFQPGTNELWLGDVGWNDVEEINRILTPTSGVLNFGWPCYEGTDPQDGYDAADIDICEDLYAETDAVTEPHFDYDHDEKVIPGEACPFIDGSAISGLAFYEGGAYPPAYDGSLFFSDYSRDCIWVMHPGADGVPDPDDKATFADLAANPVEIDIGPGGDLFYVDFGDNGGALRGSVRRIEFTGQAPSAIASADPTQGPAPLEVDFDSTGTSDPDPGDTLDYEWDLDGDGSFDDATGPTAEFTYVQGTYTARLRVTDDAGLSDISAPMVITSGNSAPTAVIDAPSPTTTWVAGQEIFFEGSATDPQDGPLPETALSWDLTLWHDGHPHPLEQWDGTDEDSFFAPGHEYPAYLELTLTATDTGGLTDSTSIRLDPQVVDLTFATDPSGLELTVGADTETAPFTRTVIVGTTNTIIAPSPQTSLGSTWGWVSWSDGGAATHEITAPAGNTTYTATFQAGAAAPNAAPSPSIDTPAPSTTWAVGEPVTFSGRAFDPQEGDLPDSSMTWRLVLHDCGGCAPRTLQTWQGTRTGSFTPPPAGPDAYLELELSAIDSQGSIGSATRRLDPRLVQVAVATKPAGLDAKVVSAPQELAASRSVIAGTEVKVRAPKRQRAEGMRFRFRGWSDGGSRIHDVVVGPGTPRLVARFRCAPGPGESRDDCKAAIADLKPAGRQPS
jgi:glucose/arabinose dehydrogenase